MSIEPEPPDRFVKLDEVKRRVGLGKSMIYRLIQEGKFPAPYKLSPLASRWKYSTPPSSQTPRISS